MMNTFRIAPYLLVLLMLSLGVERTARAADDKTSATPATPSADQQPKKAMAFVGLITAVDTAANTFTCKLDKGDVIFAVSKEAKVSKAGIKAIIDETAVGWFALGYYVKLPSGINLAHTVYVEKTPDRRHIYKGTILKVDTEAKTFICKKANGGTRVMSVSNASVITKNGAKADFNALVVGARADCRYAEIQQGKLSAEDIWVSTSKASVSDTTPELEE
jgi:hypothetical protein